jgi:DNA-binding protein YbaB
MSTQMHPRVAEALQQAQRLHAAVDEQLHKLNTESFKGADETRTVEVTLNAHQRLTGVNIEDGLLRLGTETVAQRVNEAINNARAAATAAREAEQQRFLEALDETLGLTQSKPG